jgi:hypothetical protein
MFAVARNRQGGPSAGALRDCMQRKTQIKYGLETHLWRVRTRRTRRHAATQFWVPALNASRIDD